MGADLRIIINNSLTSLRECEEVCLDHLFDLQIFEFLRSINQSTVSNYVQWFYLVCSFCRFNSFLCSQREKTITKVMSGVVKTKLWKIPKIIRARETKVPEKNFIHRVSRRNVSPHAENRSYLKQNDPLALN